MGAPAYTPGYDHQQPAQLYQQTWGAPDDAAGTATGAPAGKKGSKKGVVAVISIIVVLGLAFAALWFFTDILPFGPNSGYSGGSSSSSDRDRDRDRDRDSDAEEDNGDGDDADGSGEGGTAENGSGGDAAAPPDMDSVVGAWVFQEYDNTIELIFSNDGRFFAVNYQAGALHEVFIQEGRYTLNGNTLNVRPEFEAVYNAHTNEVLEVYDPEPAENMEISFSGNTLVLTMDYGTLTLTATQPTNMWSFNHRANASYPPPPPPAPLMLSPAEARAIAQEWLNNNPIDGYTTLDRNYQEEVFGGIEYYRFYLNIPQYYWFNIIVSKESGTILGYMIEDGLGGGVSVVDLDQWYFNINYNPYDDYNPVDDLWAKLHTPNESIWLMIFWDNGTMTTFERPSRSTQWTMYSRDGSTSTVLPTFSLQGDALVIAFPTTTRLYYLYPDSRGVFGDEGLYWVH